MAVWCIGYEENFRISAQKQQYKNSERYISLIVNGTIIFTP